MKVNLWVNDQPKEWEIEPDEFLAESLKKHRYASIKTGCEIGSCGVCTVWVDQNPVLSCCTLSARMEGKHVTTMEGVGKEAEELAKYLVGEAGEACGYCSPGFIMTVLAMTRELTHPNREQIRTYLNGNLCRCTGYLGKNRAVEKYIESIYNYSKTKEEER